MFKPYITLITTTLLVGMYQTPQADTFLLKHGLDLGLTNMFPYGQKLQNNIEALKISGIKSIYNEQVSISNVTERSKYKPSDFNDTSEEELQTRLKIHMDEERNGIDSSKLPVAKPTLKPSGLGAQTEDDLTKHLEHSKDEAQNGIATSVCINNCTILMIGDSVMGDVAMSVKRKIKKSNPDWKVIDAHKVSTGLTNSMYYNWPEIAKELMMAKKPDYTYVLIGMNDAQPISMDKHGYLFGKDSWTNEYTKRVNAIIDILKNNTSGWTWIQLPSVANETFNSKLDIIRKIQQTNVPIHNYLEVDTLIGSYGVTKDKSSIKTRAGDGIHLNVKGSDSIANVICENIKYNTTN